MREYGQIQSSFWTDPEIRSLTDQAKLLAAYLLSGPHSNGLGCFRLPYGYLSADFGWSPETVQKAFRELFQIRFILYCDETQFVLIQKFLHWNPITNANIAIARQKEFSVVPKNSSVYSNLVTSIKKYGKHLHKDFLNDLETLSRMYAKQDPILPDPDPTLILPDQDPKDHGQPPAVPNAKKELVTVGTWNAYSEAYEKRYHTKPVRNAAVNAKLKQFVDRIGKGEAPAVAAYYVRHNNSFYITKGHAVGLLLQDAEKLRTEWATNRQITNTSARQADKTQSYFSVYEEVKHERGLA